MNNKLLIGLIAAGIAGILIVTSTKQTEAPAGGDGLLTPASSLRDVHGLAVDVSDSGKLYIASHTGLYMLRGDKDLFRVGNGRDDYMGFSVHPTDPQIFFTSGHPVRGGNLGFQKSTDGGRTWKKISDGLSGPVDFHSMAVDQVDPDIIYGMYQGRMQQSTDGGHNWRYVDTAPEGIIRLAAGSTQGSLYAATTRGVQVSKDQGSSWSSLPGIDGTVIALVAHPSQEAELLAYSQQGRLHRTADDGRNWESLSVPFGNEIIAHMAYDKNNPAVIYAVTQSLYIYKTTDSGATWNQIHY